MREILFAGEDVLMRVRYVSPPGGFTCQMVMGFLACVFCVVCSVGLFACLFGGWFFCCLVLFAVCLVLVCGCFLTG